MSGIIMMALQITFVMTGFYGVNKGLEFFYDKKGGKKNVVSTKSKSPFGE